MPDEDRLLASVELDLGAVLGLEGPGRALGLPSPARHQLEADAVALLGRAIRHHLGIVRTNVIVEVEEDLGLLGGAVALTIENDEPEPLLGPAVIKLHRTKLHQNLLVHSLQILIDTVL